MKRKLPLAILFILIICMMTALVVSADTNPCDNQDNMEVPYDGSKYVQPAKWHMDPLDPNAYTGNAKIWIDKIELTSAEAPDKTVTVNVHVSGAQNAACNMGFHLYYDTRLTLMSNEGHYITKGDALASFAIIDKLETAGVITVAAASTGDYLGQGIVFSMNFKLPWNAKAGDLYPIGFQFWSNSSGTDTDLFLNENQDEEGRLLMTYMFTMGITNGYIKIKGNAPTITPTITPTPTGSPTPLPPWLVKIDSVEVSIQEPKAGEEAALTGSVADTNIMLSRSLQNDKGITWAEGDKTYKLFEKPVFQAGHTYRCIVALKAVEGKIDFNTKVTINGRKASYWKFESNHAWYYYDFVIPGESSGGTTTTTPSGTPAASGGTPSSAPAPTVAPGSASESVSTSKTIGAFTYNVTEMEATVTGAKDKSAKKLTVPATINVDGKKIPVTAISDNAFYGMKSLKTLIIGKNVTAIGKKACYKCSGLKNVTIKTTKLTTVGAKAFSGINKKAAVKLPKSKKKAYKKLLLKKGMKKTMKFK